MKPPQPESAQAMLVERIRRASAPELARLLELAEAYAVLSGAKPVPAVRDAAGNCVVCGEAGRCPGWHAEESKA